MSTKTEQLFDLITLSDELPTPPERDHVRFAGLLRSASVAQVYAATWLLWCDWGGADGFWPHFWRDVRVALAFVRKVENIPADAEEYGSYLLLFSMFRTLHRLHLSDELPVRSKHLTEHLDSFLAQWNAAKAVEKGKIDVVTRWEDKTPAWLM